MKFPRILAFVGAGILKSLFLTLRLRVEDPNGFVKSASSAPAIFCFWHNRILGITFVFRRIYPKHRKGVTVLTSASKDGEILANVVAAFGMGSARGSSRSWRGRHWASRGASNPGLMSRSMTMATCISRPVTLTGASSAWG